MAGCNCYNFIKHVSGQVHSFLYYSGFLNQLSCLSFYFYSFLFCFLFLFFVCFFLFVFLFVLFLFSFFF